MSRSGRAILIFVLAALSGRLVGINAQANETRAAADSAGGTVRRLREIKTDRMSDDIPDAARPLLKTLKHQLRDLIESALGENRDGNDLEASKVRAGVLASLRQAGVTVAPPREMSYEEALSTPYSYGGVNSVTVERRANLPGFVVATTTLDLTCGEDTSIYLFRKRGRRWRLLLAQESNDYADISGAQGLFDYRLSPPDRAGRFLLATINVNPWCTSNWQGLRYSLFAVGRGPEPPRVLARGKKVIYLGVDHPYRLRLTRREFRLDFHGESNPEEIERLHHILYRIGGARARLVRNN